VRLSAETADIGPSEPAWPPQPYAWYVVAVLTLAQALAFVDRQVLSLLATAIERDLHIDDTWMSLLYGLSFAVFYVLVALPIARLADRMNRRNIIAASITVWSVATSLCGVAANFVQLAAARIGVGAGEAGLSPSAQSIMADYFPKDRLSAAMGLFSTGISLGGGLALIGGGLLIGAAPSIAEAILPGVAVAPWRVVMVAVGLPGLLVAALFLSVREPARRGARTRAAVPVSEIVGWLVAHRWTYLGLIGALALMVFVGQSGSAWIPAFFERRFGWSAVQVGASYGPLVFLCGGAGALVGGLLASFLRRRGRPLAYLQVGLAGFAVAVVLAVAFPLASDPNLALGLIAGMLFAAGLPFGGGYGALQEITPPRMRAQITALNGLAVNLIGAGLGPLSVALLTDHVFHDRTQIHLSLSIVAGVFGPLTLLAFALALRGYRKTAAEALAHG
jgi:MFS family permease